MKKYIMLVLLLLPISIASPIISDIEHSPETVWMYDNVEITFSCYEENYSIYSVKASVISPIMIPNINIINQGNYKISIPMEYPYFGNYTLRIECISNNPEENYTSLDYKFTVYNISSFVESISPSKIYSGDQVKIYLKINRNNQNLDGSTPVNFQVFLNNTLVPFSSPVYYDPSKGWVLSFFPNEGKQNMKISYTIFGKTFFLEKDLNVNSNFNFILSSIDKSDVLSGDTINIKIFGSERDSIIDSSQVTLNFQLGSKNISPENISFIHTSTGTSIDSKIKIPEMPTGNHDLKINLNYKNSTFYFNRKINYQFEVLGKIVNLDGNFFNAKLKFKDDFDEKTITTNSSGYFYGTLNKAKYDIEIQLKDYPNYPGARVILNQTELKSFQDAIKFDIITSPNIEGIGSPVVYMFDTNLAFSKAYIELVYDKKKISSEDGLVAYKCENWSYKENRCIENMNEIDFKISSSTSSIGLELSKFSYFIIGYTKKLNIKFSTDKPNYYIKEPVKVTGYVEDQDGVAVSDANVEILLTSTGSKYNTKTDKNGVFYIEFLAPDREGNFSFDIKSSKDLFIGDAKKSNFNVEKIKKISILMDDSYKVYRGDNLTIPIKLVNIGQVDLKARISIIGINENEYIIDIPSEFSINSNEERNIQLKIFSSGNLSNIMSKIKIEYDDKIEEKQFVLIFEERQKNQEEKSFSLPSAKIVLPEFNEISFTLAVSILVITAAFILKKIKTLKRDNKLILNDIKNEINKY